MAVSASGLFIPTWLDILDASDLDVDLTATNHKVSLFTNSITPNFSTDTAYGSGTYGSNEVSGSGYTAGGATLASTTLTESPTGTIKWDAADVDWTTSTITLAHCALIYADAITDEAIALINFAADYSTVAGLFRIQWNSAGIVTFDVTP